MTYILKELGEKELPPLLHSGNEAGKDQNIRVISTLPGLAQLHLFSDL